MFVSIRRDRIAFPVFFSLYFCLILIQGGLFAAEGGKVLHVYTWADYFSPEAIRVFEEKNDCIVEFDFYDSNETMFETLSSGGGYDVMTPAPNIAVSLYEANILLSLDHSLLPNLKFLDKGTSALRQDPEMRYSVPYTVTVTGVGYNRDLVPADAVGSWDIFQDSRLAKRMTMLNDMRETIGAALKRLGYPINSVNPKEVEEAADLVREWKANLAIFSVDQGKEGLRDGKYAAIQAYNGDMAYIISQNPNLDFYVPKEGSALNSDDFVIAVDTPVPDLAHAFINHFLDPEIAAMNMEEIYYVMPNPEALKMLPPQMRKNPAFSVPQDILSKCEAIEHMNETGRKLYDDAWEKILIGDDD